MMYLPVENHFVQAIGKRLYDVSGDVTPKYLCSQIIPWETMEQYDSSLYRKLVRDCIKKERFDYDNDSGWAEVPENYGAYAGAFGSRSEAL